MGNKKPLRFLVENIQLFAENEQKDPYEQALEDTDQVQENEVQEGNPQDEKPKDEQAEEGKKVQSRADNARYAEQRRKAEKAAKEKAEKENQPKETDLYSKGRIDALGGINPYTGEPIEDEDDLHDYDLMKELDEKGENPKESFHKALREERRAKARQAEAEQRKKEEEAKKAEEEKSNRRALARTGMDELRKAHPECDDAWFKEQWESNPKFKDMLKHGITPLNAYDYLGMKPKEEPPAENPSTPSSVSAMPTGTKSVKDMSADEWIEYSKQKYGGF